MEKVTKLASVTALSLHSLETKVHDPLPVSPIFLADHIHMYPSYSQWISRETQRVPHGKTDLAFPVITIYKGLIKRLGHRFICQNVGKECIFLLNDGKSQRNKTAQAFILLATLIAMGGRQ